MPSFSELYQAKVEAGTLRSDAAQRNVAPLLDRLLSDLASPKKSWFLGRKSAPPKGVYLWGGVGRGKSMLMDLFVDAVTVPTRRVHFHAFMQDVHAAMHKARGAGAKDALRPFLDQFGSDIRLLAFDELQVTDITDAMIVGRLFEGLIERGVAIIATSNRAPDDLYKDGLNRQLFLPFIDILKDQLVIHELNSSTDYRLDRLSGEEVYFTPIDADARAQIDTLWRDLAGDDGAPLTLVVNRRNVTLAKFSNGVARASFFQLCGENLGPADYLAIAEAVRVLIVEDIPQLGRSNFNEAKRFVTLIDALYEAGVRLIASAEATPSMLYVEGTGSFEFERTASRLIEMQSKDWAEQEQ